MLSARRKTAGPPSAAAILEEVLGCKWSLRVLQQVRAGTCRPGAIERALPGLSAKVLSERLAKLTRYGILDRTSFAEIPPRVEYRLSGFGRRLVAILDQIEALEAERLAERGAG